MTVSHYSGGLAELRRLLKTLMSPTLRLTRNGKDVTAEEITVLAAEIARREAPHDDAPNGRGEASVPVV